MKTIAFASDLTLEEDRALESAVALAAASGAKLVTVHATTGATPAARLSRALEVAARWGRSVAHEGMAHTCCDDVCDTLLDALAKIRPDLVIVGTHGRSAWAQLLTESVAEGLARNVSVPTLMVPLAGRGLAGERGALRLSRVVVAAGDEDSARAGVAAAAHLAEATHVAAIEAALAHAGEGTVRIDPLPSPVRATPRTIEGALEDAIPALARELDADLIVMATRGHDEVIDTFAGSHTERVLRRCDRPLLSVPR